MNKSFIENSYATKRLKNHSCEQIKSLHIMYRTSMSYIITTRNMNSNHHHIKRNLLIV